MVYLDRLDLRKGILFFSPFVRQSWHRLRCGYFGNGRIGEAAACCAGGDGGIGFS
jgi:hypothetical protein